MLIATWNVNSVRARLPRIVPWLEEQKPDVLCLQETKVEDDKFPREPFTELGYELEVFGQKTWNGVAIASRAPMFDVTRGLPGEGPDDQRRVIEATVEGVRVINLYVPNGQAPGTEKFSYKMDWLARLRDHLEESYDPDDEIVVLGDINIAPEDRDVYDPEGLRGQIHMTDEERDALREITDWGLADAMRLHRSETGVYTWWDFRGARFQRGQGYRIDLVLVSEPMMHRSVAVDVDVTARAGEKPSDHAPVLATFED